MKKGRLYCVLLLLLTVSANAQFIQVDTTYTAQALVGALMANPCMQVSNIMVSGNPYGAKSYGYFNTGTATFPFSGGIMLSSGKASAAPGPNVSAQSASGTDWTGDNDLETALGLQNTYNATALEFDFVAGTNNISFNYVFASEEYGQYELDDICDRTDSFAFLIKPAGSNAPYKNLAVLPNSTTPVNTINVRGPGRGSCPSVNSSYFGRYNIAYSATNYNGQTTILTAHTAVVPGTAYHIKLVIADQNDVAYDSAVFLGGSTFGNTIEPEEGFICSGGDLTFNPGSGYVAYSWNTIPVQNTQTLTVTQPGTYIATLTSPEGCVVEKPFRAIRSGAATGATYEINDFMGSRNSITITPIGSGNYQYSLDSITYQQSPVFDNLTPGPYTFYINDVNGCGPVYIKSFFILDYPKFFTPNNDGYKDYWRIPYTSNRPGINVTIFDRFGKLITSFRGASTGWDGTFEGKPLPANDYWFITVLENGKSVNGHFSLIR